MESFACAEYSELSQDIIDEFTVCFQENVSQIEEILRDMETDPSDENISALFRNLHSLKGNCGMVGLKPMVDLVHAIEEVNTELREGKRTYVVELGDFIVGAICQIDSLIGQLSTQGNANLSQYNQIFDLVKSLSDLDANSSPDVLQQKLSILSEIDYAVDDDSPAAETSTESTETDKPDTHGELKFFKEMALRVDGLSIYWRGRTKLIANLCKWLDRELDSPVNEDQLKAAAYMHDFGMALVPHSIFNKQSSLTKEELRMVQEHSQVGSDLLRRMGSWTEAADIVEQHHERYDGRGYPNRLAGEAINPGAQFVAIADTFFAITNERPDRSYKKSLLRAVSEINACVDLQFDAHIVEAFNSVVRKRYMTRKA